VALGSRLLIYVNPGNGAVPIKCDNVERILSDIDSDGGHRTLAHFCLDVLLASLLPSGSALRWSVGKPTDHLGSSSSGISFIGPESD
jgi:hypothetical protein